MNGDRIGVLSSRPKFVTAVRAQALVQRYYGISGDATLLAGERDQNFLLRSADANYVLKISHPAERAAVVRFQNGALAHIAAADPTLPVPVVMPDLVGDYAPRLEVAEEEIRIVRVLSYLEGTLLHKTIASGAQDYHLGVFLARLGLALADYRERSPDEELFWDLRHLVRSRDMIGEIDDATLRSRVEVAYDECEQHALAALDGLPTQAIHNDMNPYNVVMDAADPERVCGMIDFGDMVQGALVSDMAVGAAYRWTLREHPLAGAVRFLRGYASVRRVAAAELALLFDLLRARLALTINLANWQSRRFAENRDYALRLQPELIAALAHLSSIAQSEGRRMLYESLAD